MILAALACPVFTSCYDDSALNEKIEEIGENVLDLDARLKALETKLNTELQALQTLLESKIATLEGKVDELITITSCDQKTDGSYEITLSDGKKFTVYPEYEQDLNGLVTTISMDGKLYWAVYEDGAPTVVVDAEGAPIPVEAAQPEVRVDSETGEVEITFDGEEWINLGSGNSCVFSNVEVVYTDNYTDEQEMADPYYYVEVPMYVVITLPDGNTISVTIDGVASFMFASNYGGLIESQYISAGETAAISVQAMNVSDWVKEVPAGWKVVEDTKYLKEYGQAEFHVTAPTAEAIASGAAAAEGFLKVLAVAEGGKTVTASVKVTTLPFVSFSAAKGNFTVEMNNGLGGYLVGVSKVSEYDPEAILAELKSVVEAEVENSWDAWSPWYVEENATPLDDNYFDSSMLEHPIASLKLTEELVEGEQYVVWAVGLNYWYISWLESGYSVGSIVSTPYLNASVELDEEQTVVSFNDIQIALQFKGVQNFYGFFGDASYVIPTLDEIAENVNSDLAYGYDEYIPVTWENGLYTGSPKELVSSYYNIEPATKYYLWIVPRVEGKTVYSAADVYYYEWETEPLMAGGEIAVVAAEPVLDYKKISVELSAEGAAYIYYSYVKPEMMSTIADKQSYLLEDGVRVEGAVATTSKTNLTPGTTMTLLAMAIDENGCYGEVYQQDYTTNAFEFAEVTVVAELQGTPSDTGLVKISCDAEVDTYYYWYSTKDDYYWTSTSYFGGSVDAASSFIALNPDYYFINKLAAADVPEEGIELSGLTIGSPSIFLVSAKLADGTFTKATAVEFTPEMNLGTIVYATDDNGNENPAWVAAKPTVNATVEQIGDFTTVSWTVSVPEGYTAKTTCFSEEYLMDYPSAKSKIEFVLTYPYIETFDVVEGETYSQPYASKGYNIYTVVCDSEGNYYETYVEELEISGGFGV